MNIPGGVSECRQPDRTAMLARRITTYFNVPARLRRFVIVLLSCAFAASLPVIISSCSHAPASDLSVKFVVRLKHPSPGQQVYLTGNAPRLGEWNPNAVPLTRESDSLWFVTLNFPAGTRLEYKVTAGSWWTQALDSTQALYDNFQLLGDKDTVVTIGGHDWLNKMMNGAHVIGPKSFSGIRRSVALDGLWRYHPGDSAAWAGLPYTDGDWVVADPSIQWTHPSDPKWFGIGWFRFHMYLDSGLWNRSLAIRMNQLGASQIFYDGKPLYAFGEIGSSSLPYEGNAMSSWQELKIDPQYDQLLAVRYANNDWGRLRGLGFSPGFMITLEDLNSAFRAAAGVREDAERQTVFMIVPLILFFVHLSLYGFLRKLRQNLYYALCMLGFAGITYFSHERGVLVDVGRIILSAKLANVSVTVAIFFGVLTMYDLNYDRLPKRAWAFVGIFLAVSLLGFLDYPFSVIGGMNYVFFGCTTLEAVYSIFDKKAKRLRGSSLLLMGFLALSGFVAIQMLIDYAILPQTFGTRQVYVYGILSLAISMSFYLSYNFALVNKNLEVQLGTVRQLSDKAIEQAGIAHALELERKTIELESERKSRELESARALQISLLPKNIPKLKGLDIAATMITATEVGGDIQ